MFIAFEGIEGCGKSTQFNLLKQHLEQKGQALVATREPGGTPLGEELRTLLLNPALTISAESELLLLFASRIEHSKQVIMPALLANKWVLTDRFLDSTYAYQGGGRGIKLEIIDTLAQLFCPLVPNCTILLDISPEIGLKRAKARGKLDRFEQEKLEFFHKTRDIYLQRANNSNYLVLDGSLAIEVLAAKICKHLAV